MRIFCLVATALLISGCMRWSLDRYLDSAYEAYELGDCAKVRLLLSQADREARSRPYMQPEISLLRGQCLEREGLYADARETYQYIISRYPVSEYAYRAKRVYRPWISWAMAWARVQSRNLYPSQR